MERNLKQHHFSCDLRITMSCITVYSITDSQRTSIKSIFFLALGSRALLQTTQEQSSRIFPLLLANTLFFLSLYFSVFLSNSSRTILSFFLARSDSPKLSQWIYEKGPESSSSRGCRAQFTPTATLAKATAACSKAKTFWCEQS